MTEQFTQAVAALEAKAKEVDGFIKTVNAQTEKNGEAASNAVKAAEKAAQELTVITARITELEQKMVDEVVTGKQSMESAGMHFAKSEPVRHFIEGKTNKARFEVKNTVTQTDATTPPDRQSGIIAGAFRALRVLDIVPTANTGLNVIESTREASWTNNAAETAEGSSKPESDITFELVTTNMRTIAHWIKVSRQLVDDAPAIANYIDVRLNHGLRNRLDSQLLNGDGTAPNISGITDSGNFTAFNPLTGDNAIDSVAKAISAVTTGDYAASGIIMNSADFWAIQLIKASTSGVYLYGNPASTPTPSLWGLPVITTNNLAAGKLIVADFAQAYQFWQRQGVMVEMSDSDSDNFTKNLVTIRAEMRGGLETRVPAAVRYGNLTA